MYKLCVCVYIVMSGVCVCCVCVVMSVVYVCYAECRVFAAQERGA